MECGAELAAKVFGPSYKRASKMQVTLALTATISALASWLLSSELLWLIGAVLIFAVIPFTLIAIMPTNKKLLATNLDGKAQITKELLERWGKLHGVRSILGLAATSVFLYLSFSIKIHL
jgi:hypothetical protein